MRCVFIGVPDADRVITRLEQATGRSDYVCDRTDKSFRISCLLLAADLYLALPVDDTS